MLKVSIELPRFDSARSTRSLGTGADAGTARTDPSGSRYVAVESEGLFVIPFCFLFSGERVLRALELTGNNFPSSLELGSASPAGDGVHLGPHLARGKTHRALRSPATLSSCIQRFLRALTRPAGSRFCVLRSAGVAADGDPTGSWTFAQPGSTPWLFGVWWCAGGKHQAQLSSASSLSGTSPMSSSEL
jgi:hypothetical protein